MVEVVHVAPNFFDLTFDLFHFLGECNAQIVHALIGAPNREKNDWTVPIASPHTSRGAVIFLPSLFTAR